MKTLLSVFLFVVVFFGFYYWLIRKAATEESLWPQDDDGDRPDVLRIQEHERKQVEKRRQALKLVNSNGSRKRFGMR